MILDKLFTDLIDGAGQVGFRCPGCGYSHYVTVGTADGKSWGWNKDSANPTFTPSILVTTTRQDLTDEQWVRYDAFYKEHGRAAVMNNPEFGWRCHSFVHDGNIQFLGDCSHYLKNQTVRLPEWGAKT